MRTPKRYDIRFRKRAKQEVERTKYLGDSFNEPFSSALQEIAEAAANKDTSNSVDYLEFLEDSIEFAESGNSSTRMREKWRKALPIDKIKALIFFIKNRRMPWEIRKEIRWIFNILGVFDSEIHFIYEIDHINERVVFVKFLGMPGQTDEVEVEQKE
jgi:hypothetical protein